MWKSKNGTELGTLFHALNKINATAQHSNPNYTRAMKHLLILGDQLSDQVAPILGADPTELHILMIESLERSRVLPYHKQKLALLYSAMRHFRLRLEGQGFTVHYQQTSSFAEGVQQYVQLFPGATLHLLEPAEWGTEQALRAAVEGAGGSLVVLPNPLWLCSDADWQQYAGDKKQFRMEFFYRQMRRKTGYLMENGQPVGGQWNFDAENRKVPPAGHRFPPKLELEPDAITLETLAWVEASFPSHFGTLENFNWAVTREQALLALDHFLLHRLANFGPFEDAMQEGEEQLYHSLLSPALNLGLLTTQEVCEAALERYHQSSQSGDIPLESIEGFIRQILGWREFMFRVYRNKMPEFKSENQLEHHHNLPDFYWTGQTEMRCLSSAVLQLERRGHTHHIPRLMVLGNFALLSGISPQQLNNWFLTTFVDAFDWVVTPNVLGMSQFADMGSFTSKPYVSGGAYISRMSNHCKNCIFDPKKTVGHDACPFSSLYWHFLERHKTRFQSNVRMSLVYANWNKRSDQDLILARAEAVLEHLF